MGRQVEDPAAVNVPLTGQYDELFFQEIGSDSLSGEQFNAVIDPYSKRGCAQLSGGCPHERRHGLRDWDWRRWTGRGRTGLYRI